MASPAPRIASWLTSTPEVRCLSADYGPARIMHGIALGRAARSVPRSVDNVAAVPSPSRAGMDTPSLETLLREWRTGDQSALDRMVPLVYAELRRLARGQLRRDPAAHSVEPTVLVHEAYLRLLGARVDWRDRTHFLSVAARVMRRILVERARARRATKRGGGDVRVTLTGSVPAPAEHPVDILILDAALERLHGFDDRQAQRRRALLLRRSDISGNRRSARDLRSDRRSQSQARSRLAQTRAGQLRLAGFRPRPSSVWRWRLRPASAVLLCPPPAGESLEGRLENLTRTVRFSAFKTLLDRDRRAGDALPLAVGHFHPRVREALPRIEGFARRISPLPVQIPVTTAESP